MKTHLVWFRRDLRVADNPALAAACRDAGARVMAVYCLTRQTWQRHDVGQRQVDFMLQHVASLSSSLAALNIPLLILDCDLYSEVTEALMALCQQHTVKGLFTNAEYVLDERRRDALVKKSCDQHAVDFHQYGDRLMVSPDSLKTQQDKPYQVFTPFKKKWLNLLSLKKPFPTPTQRADIGIAPDGLPAIAVAHEHWPIGEEVAHARLQRFCENKLFDYKNKRDFPALNNTSQVSAYLSQGVLSANQCIHAMFDALQVDTISQLCSDAGAACWLSELIWREFYQYIAYHFPHVCQHKPFKPATENIVWHKNNAHLEAWKSGRTGIPIVDAAMRQLNQTGWMHNRLRMVVAMFFSKNCFLDWRLGERYFMQQLIDGDFASNNGGWQWSASTGTDSAPYFRVFNPISQSEKFDSKGDFIRRYCPELESLTAKQIHQPDAYGKHELDYPPPIVDLKTTRADAITAFKKLN
ncbi:MAG: deoxyribodipyrimidine photo-lyase [marine bacterium B5-7]|nr:MAG: deoxyribodipyrimidine photo-lyase [marine bacterium B5-7]